MSLASHKMICRNNNNYKLRTNCFFFLFGSLRKLTYKLQIVQQLGFWIILAIVQKSNKALQHWYKMNIQRNKNNNQRLRANQ